VPPWALLHPVVGVEDVVEDQFQQAGESAIRIM
jgi:hypothetical protein